MSESSLIRIPFEYHWRVTKGAGNRGTKQAPVVCENTAGGGEPSVTSAARGQACLQVARQSKQEVVPCRTQMARLGTCVWCIGSGTGSMLDIGSGWSWREKLSGRTVFWLTGIRLVCLEKVKTYQRVWRDVDQVIWFSSFFKAFSQAICMSGSARAELCSRVRMRDFASSSVLPISWMIVAMANVFRFTWASIKSIEPAFSSVIRIPFENHWCVTKGAGNRGGKQASVVCENTAGRGSPSVAFADRGQARLQVAPKTSLLNLGRVGADCAARPVFWGAFYG
jgi:hypothetical protein